MVLDRPAPSSIMFRQGVRTVSVELTLAHSEVARNQPSGTNGGEVEAPTSTWDKGIQDDGKDTLTDVPDLEGAQVQTTRHGVQAKTSSDVEEIQTRSLDVDAL